MATVVSKIKVRRGPEADFIGGSGVVLDEGEFGYVLDTRDLYIGYGSQYFPAGNMKLISQLDGVDQLAEAAANYSMGGHRLVNVGRAVNDFDAVTLIDLQSFFLATERTTNQVTLAVNTGSPADCMTDATPSTPGSTSLNAIAGAYTGFRVYYTLTRGTALQSGMLLIADTGTACDIVDHSVELPSVGSVGVEFSVAYVAGVRRLQYISTAGSSMTMRYSIDRWA